MSFVSHFVKKKAGPRLGNVLVWMLLVIGPPLWIMMYYHDYVITHFGDDFKSSP
jgi:diacylglycerol O-acyltransferase-1